MINSGIEWTRKVYDNGFEIAGFTHNEWIGCQHVSPGCVNCYAEFSWDNRKHWGNNPRLLTTEKNRNRPFAWHKQARRQGVRPFVFPNSLSDIFENQEQVNKWRPGLLSKIEQCFGMDWLLLTKRIELVNQMIPEKWLKSWPTHIWLGVSVEDERRSQERVGYMENFRASHPDMKLFVSYEPALESVDWTRWSFIDWLIAGGESESPAHERSNARPMPVEAARSARDFALDSEIDFYFKQWGEWLPTSQAESYSGPFTFSSCPLLVTPYDSYEKYYKVGKKFAGNLLDGIQHIAFPGHDQPPELVDISQPSLF